MTKKKVEKIVDGGGVGLKIYKKITKVCSVTVKYKKRKVG